MVVKEGGIVARPGTIFGGKAGGIMGTMQRVVSRLPIVPMIGMGSTRLYMVHVTDLSRCLERLARTPDEFRGSVVSIAALKPITFRALLAAMAAAEHRRRIFVPIPGALIRAGLVIAETLGLRLPLRSDSVVSLLAGNPRVELDGRFENLEPFSVRLS
jgi:nucleoside-diphosphate-sugar epimerase